MATAKQNDVIFNYLLIEAGCLNNPDVHIKEVQISKSTVLRNHCNIASFEIRREDYFNPPPMLRLITFSKVWSWS